MSGGAAHLLTAVEPLPAGDWIRTVESALSGAGQTTQVQRYGVLAWEAVRSERGIRYSNGWAVKRLWLGPRRWAAAMSLRRLYFKPGSDELDTRPEYEIVGASRPDGPSNNVTLDHARRTTEALRVAFESSDACVVELTVLDDSLAASREIVIGTQRHPWNTGTLNAIYRSSGFDVVPEHVVVSVCPWAGVPARAFAQFIQRCRSAASHRAPSISFRESRPQELEQRLDTLGKGHKEPRPGHCVLFLLPPRSEPPPEDFLALIRRLEAKGVPYRRAHSDDAFEYSIPDQLPSILLACGGHPHRVDLGAIREELWSIGIDLSHRGDRSTLALTLVDPAGRLHRAWTATHQRDETARASTLSPLLVACREYLDSQPDCSNVLVLRDGRLFEHETAQLYELRLARRVTLLEYRKRGNPLIVQTDWSAPSPAPGAYQLDNLPVVFLCTTAPRSPNTLANVSKVVWRAEWNQLELSPVEIARALVRLSAAPGLGMHMHHLPAPLYWADGIAGTSDTDLRFRGQLVQRF